METAVEQAGSVTGGESQAAVAEEVVEKTEGKEEEAETEGSEEGEEGEEEEAEGEEGKGEKSEEGEKKPDHKLTANERIQQLIAKDKEKADKIAVLEQRLNESEKTKQAADIPFVDVDWNKVESKLAVINEEIDTLKIEGKHLEAAKKQRDLLTFLDDLEKNEVKRQEWTEAKQKESRQKQTHDAKLQKLDDAAEFYRKEMNVPEEVWHEGGKWFSEECSKNPVLGRKFAEMAETSPVAAIEFAHRHTTENMGKQAEAAKATREEAKEKTVTTGGQGGSASPVTTFNDLMNLSDKEIVRFQKENPTKYEQILNKRLKGG